MHSKKWDRRLKNLIVTYVLIKMKWWCPYVLYALRYYTYYVSFIPQSSLTFLLFYAVSYNYQCICIVQFAIKNPPSLSIIARVELRDMDTGQPITGWPAALNNGYNDQYQKITCMLRSFQHKKLIFKRMKKVLLIPLSG